MALPTEEDINAGAAALFAFIMGWTGSAWERIRSNSGALVVELAASDGHPGSGDLPLVVATKNMDLYSDFGTSTTGMTSLGDQFLRAIAVTNNNASGRWFQIFDQATSPVALDMPNYSFWVAPGTMVSLGEDFFGSGGRLFNIGVAWGWSTGAGPFATGATASNHTTHIHLG